MNRLMTIVAGLAVGTALFAGNTAPAAAAAAPMPALHDGESELYKSLIGNVGPAMVSIKMVLKLEGGGDQAQDVEVTGLMIDPKGLILVSNAMIGGMMRMMTITPTNIKVLFEDDDDSAEGISAKLIARDSELDLAWFQIDDEKAKDRTFKAVDMSAGAAPELGDSLYTIRRMDKFFDRVTVIAEGRVAGKTTKPRAMVVPSGFQVEPGGPVFGADGKLVGFGAFILPGDEDLEMSSIGQLYGRTGPLILPVVDVKSATDRAKEVAANAPAEEPAAAAPAEKPAEEPKP